MCQWHFCSKICAKTFQRNATKMGSPNRVIFAEVSCSAKLHKALLTRRNWHFRTDAESVWFFDVWLDQNKWRRSLPTTRRFAPLRRGRGWLSFHQKLINYMMKKRALPALQPRGASVRLPIINVLYNVSIQLQMHPIAKTPILNPQISFVKFFFHE